MNDTPTKKTEPFEISLDDLDLDGIMTPPSEWKKPKPKAKPKPKLSAAEAEAARKERELIYARLPKWNAEATILVLTKTRCKCCGTVYFSPAAETLLVRFRNIKRPDETWEIAHHPTLARPNLPREAKTLEISVEVCQNCFSTEEEELSCQ